MHELSLIANLFEILEKEAKAKKAKKIVKVELKVGLLSGVVPELLKTAFDMYKQDTLAAESELAIETVPLHLQCQTCSTEMIKEEFVFTCSKCGASNLKTLAGTELYLQKMEIEV